MTKLNCDEADYILLNISKLIISSKTTEERTLLEGIKDKIIADYEVRIANSKQRTKNLNNHLNKLKEKMK